MTARPTIDTSHPWQTALSSSSIASSAVDPPLSPATDDTLVLNISADPWPGASQFLTKVDGVQQGGVNTVTASAQRRGVTGIHLHRKFRTWDARYSHLVLGRSVRWRSGWAQSLCELNRLRWHAFPICFGCPLRPFPTRRSISWRIREPGASRPAEPQRKSPPLG